MPVKNKSYYRLKVTEHHHRLKKKAVEYKGGSCKVCGYKKCLSALVFHHRDPSQKDFALSQWKSASWDSMKLELDKCDLLCSNCHNELHEAESAQRFIELERQVRLEVPVRVTAEPVQFICEYCKKPFTAYLCNRPNAKFCSVECKAKSQIVGNSRACGAIGSAADS
jgi:hypothetical protein